MAVGSFVFDFFFGPCLDNSAVDQRQNYYEQQSQQQSQRLSTRETHNKQSLSQRKLQIQQQRQHSNNNYSYRNGQRSSSNSRPRSHSRNRSERSRSRSCSSQRHLVAIPEGDNVMNGNGNKNQRTRSTSRIRNNNSTRNINGSANHSTSSSTSRGGGIQKSKSYTSSSSRHRRDDASIMSTSLFETSTQFLNDDDIDEQIAIGRSIRDAHRRKNGKKSNNSSTTRGGGGGLGTLPEHNENGDEHSNPTANQKQQNRPQSSNKSELESYIERGNHNAQNDELDDEDDDYDNVTTISKASKNPYRVLGISQGASPREIYTTYKRKLKETEGPAGEHSDKAFADVGNAYRRLKADIQRQEARKERKRLEEEKEEEQQQQEQLQQQQQQSRRRGRRKKNNRRNNRRQTADDDDDDEEESVAISRRNNIDARLKDHRELVHDLFARDNNSKKKDNKNNKVSSSSDASSVSSKGQVSTLQDSVLSQSKALSEMNLVPVEAGAANINEKNETIQNSCFYLSLAASYLSGTGSFDGKDPTEPYFLNSLGNNNSKNVEMDVVKLPKKQKNLTMKLALQLKRAIEAAVLLVHPDWAKTGQVGEEVQAFSDFLVYALDSDSVLGHWAICVFDEASGFADVYRGRHYGKIYPPTKVKSRKSSSSRVRVKYKYKDCDDATKRTNTLTLRYIPGHYQPLLPELTKMAQHQQKEEGSKNNNHGGVYTKRAMLEDILTSLEKWNVLYIVTDGRA